MLGIDDVIGLTSAAGYLHARLFSTILPVVLLVFGIGLGTRALAGAEEDGTLELTLPSRSPGAAWPPSVTAPRPASPSR